MQTPTEERGDFDREWAGRGDESGRAAPRFYLRLMEMGERLQQVGDVAASYRQHLVAKGFEADAATVMAAHAHSALIRSLRHDLAADDHDHGHGCGGGHVHVEAVPVSPQMVHALLADLGERRRVKGSGPQSTDGDGSDTPEP